MKEEINWDSLTFKFIEPDSMYVAVCDLGEPWEEKGIVPFSSFEISPAACVLNYGQGLFEGLKAQVAADGAAVLFRPAENAKRMQAGAERMCMPLFPEDRFVEAVRKTVKANLDYLPPAEKGSLYIRVCLWGTGPMLGVNPAPSYMFCVFVSPVGPYFKGGVTPIKLEITKEFHRAAPRGTGGVKAIGNYAGSMYCSGKTKKRGFAEAIYLNASNDRYIEEVGTANFFCIIGEELHTPKLTGSILPGITRDSVITLARDILGITVHEREIDYEEVFEADEAFCTGTAAVISPIGSISFDEKEYVYNNFEVGEITGKLYDLLTGIQTKKREDPYGWVVEV